jgi:hypothetical protein
MAPLSQAGKGTPAGDAGRERSDVPGKLMAAAGQFSGSGTKIVKW